MRSTLFKARSKVTSNCSLRSNLVIALAPYLLFRIKKPMTRPSRSLSVISLYLFGFKLYSLCAHNDHYIEHYKVILHTQEKLSLSVMSKDKYIKTLTYTFFTHMPTIIHTRAHKHTTHTQTHTHTQTQTHTYTHIHTHTHTHTHTQTHTHIHTHTCKHSHTRSCVTHKPTHIEKLSVCKNACRKQFIGGEVFNSKHKCTWV